MAAIDIIIAVDTQGALATGRVVDHAYMVDSHGFLGSWTEGQPSLSTVCEDGDVLTWRAVSATACVCVFVFVLLC